jgi:hypothetical protein
LSHVGRFGDKIAQE